MNTSVCLESINQTNLRAKGQNKQSKDQIQSQGIACPSQEIKANKFFISQSYSIARRQDFTVDTVTTQTIKTWAWMV